MWLQGWGKTPGVRVELQLLHHPPCRVNRRTRTHLGHHQQHLDAGPVILSLSASLRLYLARSLSPCTPPPTCLSPNLEFIRDLPFADQAAGMPVALSQAHSQNVLATGTFSSFTISTPRLQAQSL